MTKMNIVFVLVLLMSAFAFADVQFGTATVTPTTLRPGNTGSVSFTITNAGTSGITALTLYPSGNGFEFSNDRISIGTVGASGTTSASIQFRVSPNTESGVYNIMINAYWSENTVAGGSSYKLIQIPVTVSKQTIFQISSEPMNVGIGDDFELNAMVKNTGGRASNIVVSINSPYFIAKDSTKLSLGDLGKGEEEMIAVPILTNLSMPAGIYAIPAIISYQDELGNIQQVSATLGTVRAVRGTVDFSVGYDIDSSATPGKRVRMTITVRNDGSLVAKSVKTTLSSASSSFVPLGSSQRLLGEIPPAGTESVTYDVGISSSATPGYYPATVTIDFLNAQGEPQTSITKSIGIEVLGESKLAIITSTTPSPVSSGNKYSLGIQISNIGTSEVRSLTVTLESDSFTILDNSPSSFIGNLKTDDYSQVSYNVRVSNDVAPGKYPITVRMKFMDAYNAEREIVETSYLQVVSSNGDSGGGLLDSVPIALVGLAFVVVAAYLVYRRCTKCNGKK
ncbi:MAG: hypothetical protein ABIF01_03435 [Candidatus Micrarchaeota archaeon]